MTVEPLVEIEKIVPGGFGLVRHEGQVVLVRGGIPGERVRVAIERSGKGGVRFARVVEVVDASPDRVEPDVDVLCGGLSLAHVTYARQLDLKREMLSDALRRTGRLSELPAIAVTPSPERGWRMRARLHVDRGQAGFFKEGTHELCQPTESQLPASMRRAAEAVLAWTPEAIRHAVAEITVAEDLAGARRAIHLALRHPFPADRWPSTPPADIVGVSAMARAAGAPADVVGDPVLTVSLADLCGGTSTTDAATTVDLSWHPAAFFQANRVILPAVVGRVLAALDERPVVDLFAGVGVFGVSAAGRGRDVLCVEGDAVAARWLQRNAAAVAMRTGARVDTIEEPIETFVSSSGERLEARTVIVDPPRTGLPPLVCRRLCETRDARVVYVSCDPPTLARDLRQLVGAGFAVTSIEAFDMFPQTAHLETLAVLDRPGAVNS